MSDAPIVYVDNGITYYRASSLGYCPNAFIFARQGNPTRIPPSMQAAFNYGIDNEAKVIEMLRRRGYAVYGQQQEVTLHLRDGELVIVGHLDGLAESYKGTPIPRTLVEVKCLNAENTEKFLDDSAKYFPNYMLQVSAYYHAAACQRILFAIYNKDTDELHERFIEPPFTISHLTDHVLMLEGIWQVYQQFDTKPDCDKSSFCPYYYLHESADLSVIEDTQLQALLRLHQRISSNIAAAQSNKDRVDKRLKAYMIEQGYTKGQSGNYTFNLQEITSNRLDIRAVTKYLKDNQPKLYGTYTIPQSTYRLTVETIDDSDGTSSPEKDV